MSSPESVANRFYSAFARRDAAAMAACYAPDATFADPVFPDLRGGQVGLMWRMLCERGTDLRVEWAVRRATEREVVTEWQAWYTFRATGRTVHNRITARMTVEQGLIRRHRDDFAFPRWARQALGWKGALLGWAPPVRDAVRREAARALDAFAGGGMTGAGPPGRHAAVRRGQWLVRATLAYNCLEAVLAVAAGLLAGSVALVGFGGDSVIEVTASLAALWRLRTDADPDHRALAERRALRVIGVSFLALAGWVAVEAVRALVAREAPAVSPLGIAIAAVSLVVMPLLARAKRGVARALESRAIRAEARQTDICMYLSAILLGGLVLNALLGWWWADPVAALGMAPLIAWEGREALRGRPTCDDCAPGSVAPADPGHGSPG